MTSLGDANSACKECQKFVHLIFYAPGADMNTFHHAGLTLKKDYEKYYPNDLTKIMKFSNGEDLVEKINMQADGSILSLDIVSHGNQAGIHVTEKLNPPEPSYFAKRNAHMMMRGVSSAEAEFMEETMKGLYSSKSGAMGISYYFNQKLFKDESILGRLYGKVNSDYMNDGVAMISEINSDKFAANAFIEFHGCRTAEYITALNDLSDNFAENFAEHIGKNCIVIGHIVNNYPDKHPSGSNNDYRHNKVRIYSNMRWYWGGDADESDVVERWGLTFPNSSTPPLKK